MLNFPPQIASRLQRAVDTLRLLAGQDSNGVAHPILTDTSGVLQVSLVNWRETYTWWVSGTLVTGTGALRFHNKTDRTLTFKTVHLAIGTAPTGAAIIVDVHKNGTTIFTTQANRPQIAIGANSGASMTFDVTTLANLEYLTLDIDQVGSVIAGANLVIQIILG